MGDLLQCLVLALVSTVTRHAASNVIVEATPLMSVEICRPSSS
jgi:hypothetical protein